MTAAPFVAGEFKSEPVRVHAYHSVGKFMLVDVDNGGCWTDPEGRVVLPSLELVDRVLKAHGYERDEMVVRKIAAPSAPTPPAPPESEPEPQSESSSPSPAPEPVPAPAPKPSAKSGRKKS